MKRGNLNIFSKNELSKCTKKIIVDDGLNPVFEKIEKYFHFSVILISDLIMGMQVAFCLKRLPVKVLDAGSRQLLEYVSVAEIRENGAKTTTN